MTGFKIYFYNYSHSDKCHNFFDFETEETSHETRFRSSEELQLFDKYWYYHDSAKVLLDLESSLHRLCILGAQYHSSSSRAHSLIQSLSVVVQCICAQGWHFSFGLQREGKQNEWLVLVVKWYILVKNVKFVAAFPKLCTKSPLPATAIADWLMT